MEETPDFHAYLTYFLIAAYYMIMLRLWLPPPPSDGREDADDKKAAVLQDRNSSRAALRQITLAKDNGGEPVPLTKSLQSAEPLDRICAADKHFHKGAFISGASQAYELVVNAYAMGDTSTLKSLLGPEAAATFCNAIHERRDKGENITLDFVCIRELNIVDTWFEAGHAEITVRFVSELVTVTRAADNTIIDGDPERIVTVTDLWTFARRVPSSNPNWKIVATKDS